MRFALYLFYCIEGGLFLGLVPWTPLWDSIFFFRPEYGMTGFARSGLVRGMVTGVGVSLLLEGIVELGSATVSALRRLGGGSAR